MECGTELTDAASNGLSNPASLAPTPARTLPESFADGRYQVDGFLGEGARKLVYRATDTRLGREVAVAEVKVEGLDEDALARVWHEARSMARLGGHPNIVTVFDVLQDGATPVVVSQYMAGGSLADLLAEDSEHRLAQDRAVDIAIDICRALDHAHGLGIVHRDLKPANIWLDGQGRALLGDFGLALGGDGPRVTVEGMMLGTVAYMPPEQAVGREADARSDLYSLGAVLYEMITGRPPFLGQDAVAVISQHLNTAPVLPTWFNSDVDSGLEALVMELLAKGPDQRPGSAADVESRLASVGTASAPPAAPPRAEGSATTWRFVGREAELATLRSAIDGAASGRGSMVMLVGEPGIGKTRTTEQAGAYASLRGMQVLVGRCYEGDASIPYLPFIEAIRTHVMATGADQLRSELGNGGSDVAKLVSEVRERVAELPPAAAVEGPDQERRRLFESVTSFLVNASAATPIMLVLDDLHWSDRPSLLLLRHLARHLPTSRILVVGTYRDVELDRRHPLSEVLSDLRRESSFERLLLRGLNPDEVLDFLEAAAERQLDGPMRRLIPILHRETEGNPFFIREVLVHMVFTGQFVRRNDRWELADPDLDHLGIPEGVREVVGRRLSRLSEPANAALADAAVLGREFEFPVLARMADLPEDELLGLVEEALVSQLIVERHSGSLPTYAFSHALVRETLYEELSLPRKQRKHLAAGQALEAVHVRDRDRILPILASHFRLAGAAADPAVSLDYALRAADAALAVFAWEDGIAHLEAALEVMEETDAPAPDRAALAVRLGDLIFTSAAGQSAGIAYLERALALYQEIGEERRAAQVHVRLGRSLTAYGMDEATDLVRGIPHLRAAEAVLVDGTDRASLVYLYQSLTTAAYSAGDYLAGVEAGTRALEMSTRLGDDRLVASSEVLLAINLPGAGRLDEGLARMEAAEARNHELGQAYSRWVAAMIRANYRWVLGDLIGSEAGVRCELARLGETVTPLLRRSLTMGLALCLIRQGRLDEALQAASEASADETLQQEPAYLIVRGEWDEAERRARETSRAMQARGVGSQAWRCAYEQAIALGQLGRNDEAVAVLEARIGAGPCLDLFSLSLMATLGAESADPRAPRWLEQLESLPILRQDSLGATTNVSRARAAVAAAQDRHEEAIQHLTGAVDTCTRYGAQLDRAELLGRRARSLTSLGRVADALADYSAALEIYETAGAGSAWIEPIVAARLDLQGVRFEDTGASIAVVAASVVTEKPDLGAHAAEDGTVTLIFTDLGDSTSLNERLGDRAWFDVLNQHHELVRSLVAHHGGTTVKSQGDGFMLAFPSARRAVECALAIHRAASVQMAGDEALAVRIGIHTGEVLRQGEDFFGRHVNLAARIASTAAPGEILVSSLVRGLVRGDNELSFVGPREVNLKGFDQAESVYALALT